MRKAKVLQFLILFGSLSLFSVVSLGSSGGNLPLAISSLQDNTEISQDTFYLVVEDNFDLKVLDFLAKEKVCMLTSGQAEILAGKYTIENKEFEVNDELVKVLYVNGNPINRNIIEEDIGESFGDRCQVVHGNQLVALLSPIFVS